MPSLDAEEAINPPEREQPIATCNSSRWSMALMSQFQSLVEAVNPIGGVIALG